MHFLQSQRSPQYVYGQLISTSSPVQAGNSSEFPNFTLKIHDHFHSRFAWNASKEGYETILVPEAGLLVRNNN
jgi:hypothetical protein